MVKDITDELLYQYVPEAEEQWIQTVDDFARQHEEPVYSESFRKLLKEQMRYGKRKELICGLIRFVRKTASFLVLFVLAAFIACMSVKATRMIIIEFVEKIYTNCTDYIYNLKEGGSSEYGLIEPKYIPGGYEEIGREDAAGMGTYIYYQNDKNEEIEYMQMVADGLTVTLDTERAITKDMEIHGIKVEYFTNKDVSYVYWTERNCYYSLTGRIEEQELIRMAETVIKNN